ncbi:Small ubiquitin-related modifier 2 [Forsythia ovata]|uniref:Small ubiquitin-related modifier n=1 Tax=Forsythia ovata TaxID=205694 RepID=A0ABD1WDC4_9LAMI
MEESVLSEHRHTRFWVPICKNLKEKSANDQSVHINLKVRGQDGNEVLLRIKRSTQLKNLTNTYYEGQSVDFNSIAFLFDGSCLRAEKTLDEAKMEDGDELDTMLHQTRSVAA